jgi:NTP pyrophosphatase (non-canonical NTP hydrolase)
MKTLYEERDRKRGIEKSLMWLQTELGELFEAYLKADKKILEEEVADILAWLCSVCNLLEINLDRAAWEKYPSRCPKCDMTPCSCIF